MLQSETTSTRGKSRNICIHTSIILCTSNSFSFMSPGSHCNVKIVKGCPENSLNNLLNTETKHLRSRPEIKSLCSVSKAKDSRTRTAMNYTPACVNYRNMWERDPLNLRTQWPKRTVAVLIKQGPKGQDSTVSNEWAPWELFLNICDLAAPKNHGIYNRPSKATHYHLLFLTAMPLKLDSWQNMIQYVNKSKHRIMALFIIRCLSTWGLF